MGFIKEPLDVDFAVDSRPLTKKEKEAISKYIRDYQAKQSENKKTLKSSRKKNIGVIYFYYYLTNYVQSY